MLTHDGWTFYSYFLLIIGTWDSLTWWSKVCNCRCWFHGG